MAAKFQDIVKLINSAITDFNKNIPGLQTDMLNGILDELRRLDVDQSNNIKTTVNNLKVIGSVKNKLGKLILNDDYISQVKDFVSNYQQIATLQNEYWKTVEAKFTPKPLLREIRIQAIDDTVNSLTENGIGPNIEDEIAQVLRIAITSGGSYRQLEDQLRGLLTDTKKDDGLLTKYTRQITTDAINQYSRQYTKAVSDDLNLVWYSYANSLIETSRPFCIAMHERNYFHVSEIPDLLAATDLYYTNPKTGKHELVPIYDKTGLPQGMYDTENADNFLILLGGYNCGHQARPVTDFSVPPYAKYKIDPKTEIEKVQTLAKESAPEVQVVVDKYEEKFGTSSTSINLKSYNSIKRKVDDELGGHIEQVKDAVRSTVIVDGPQARKAAFEAAQKDPQITRVKFQEGEAFFGYKGVLMNIKTNNGLFAEVQVNTPYMIYAKELPADAQRILGQDTWDMIKEQTGLEGGLGHHYYEVVREIDPKTASEIDLRTREQAINDSIEYYNHFSDL